MDRIMLRDYQCEMFERLQRAWGKYRSVMVQMPTGTGKTVLLAEVIRQFRRGNALGAAGGEVLIVAHRRELLQQIRDTIRAFGMDDVGIVVESIQKLSRHIGDIDMEPSLIIVDEAHHAVARTYRRLWDRWPGARFLGMTATPCRMNNTSFTDLFDTLLQSYPIQEFIDRGWLSDFEYVSVSPNNWITERIAGLKKRGADGDYQTKEMATVMDTPESIEHLYLTYEQYARGKKGIVYAISREHARHISEYYVSKGVRCCWIEARTPGNVRQQLVDDYRQGRLDVIVNVDIFSEGFDCPEVEFIQLARPTLSLCKYLQQVGRGMRTRLMKEYVIILDQVGMYQTFGLPTEERDWEGMFRGRVTGKALPGEERPVIIRDEGSERVLVNLDMIRIKRHGEKSSGIEIFIKGGKYGILNEGKVICAPEFEKVTRLEAPYFALGTYPFYVFRNRVEIIDADGHVMKPGLYGNVHREQDIFIGQDITGRTDYWDAKGGRHYRVKPTFDRIAGIEVARVGEQVYMRKDSKQWDEPIDLNSIYLHDVFLIMGKMLIFRSDRSKVYEVCGYENGGIYIKSGWGYDKDYPYACIHRSGDIFSYEKKLPPKLSPRPVNIDKMGMKRYLNESRNC